ncbi:MAG: endospore germination permease [Desulfotomaculaceae bacterium]|nr:endospore germination permease [Desulfotomaculaceae bacterium]
MSHRQRMVGKIIKEGMFGPGEAVILLAISSISRLFLSYPGMLFEIGGPATWLTPLGGLVLALAAIFVLSLVLKKSPGSTIVEINEQAFGPYLGVAVNILAIVMVLELLGATYIREFSEAMLVTTLRFTPISVVDAAFLALGLLGAYLGIEALARTARLTYLYVLAALLFVILALIPFWNFHNLLPLLGKGPKEVFILGSLSTATLAELVIAGVIIQAMGGAEKLTRIGYRFIFMGFGLMMITLLDLVLTYNWTVSEEFTQPFLRLARTIYLGRFFQRLEAIFILVWVVVGALKIALLLYATAVSLARSLKLPDYRPLLWPLGLAMYILSLLPVDMVTTIRLDNYLRWLLFVPAYLLPLLILAALWLKGRGARAGN